MLSARTLTTLFCQNLLHTPDEPFFTHLTLHIPLRTITGYFRTTFDNRHSTLSFCIAPQRCAGYALNELDGENWDGPRLISWLTLNEYTAHNPEPIPAAKPWSVLLRLFATVDLITDRSLHSASGKDLAKAAPYIILYHIFD